MQLKNSILFYPNKRMKSIQEKFSKDEYNISISFPSFVLISFVRRNVITTANTNS